MGKGRMCSPPGFAEAEAGRGQRCRLGPAEAAVMATFQSILYQKPVPAIPEGPAPEPDFARDLNLDQLVRALAARHPDQALEPYFYDTLHDADDIAYRQEVMRDLEVPAIRACIGAFLGGMGRVREILAAVAKLYYPLQKERVFVDAIGRYAEAVSVFTTGLADLPLGSRGLRALLAYLQTYTADPAFRQMRDETAQVLAALGTVHYCMHIYGSSVTVSNYADQPDYSAKIEEIFSRFRQGSAKGYAVRFRAEPHMNHVEYSIFSLVAKLNPEPFGLLQAHVSKQEHFADPVIVRFVREIHFFLAYSDHIAPLRATGLPFCYPDIAVADKHVFAEDTFDLALAGKLVAAKTPMVTNGFSLAGSERIFVVSGPNQGGKTTFVRTFGQLHHLASLGLPVPGTRARLYLYDRIFTHFEREESVTTLRGKLQDDLIRIHEILERITPSSLVLMNEIFSSTTLDDAVFLATEVMRRIIRTDCLAVFVTFMDELASLDRKIVSMTSTVVPEDPARRTLKVIRRPADGRAYAVSLAEKYRITRAWLERRLAS
ncbi:MAG: MutS-related protein [Acetobacteraceae bacterium]